MKKESKQTRLKKHYLFTATAESRESDSIFDILQQKQQQQLQDWEGALLPEWYLEYPKNCWG